jgi:hypothetical protein
MKSKLLISRIRDWRCELIQKNKNIAKNFDLIVIDHSKIEPQYEKMFNARYVHTRPVKEQIIRIIKKHKITHAIVAQKLHEIADATYEACIECGVKTIWTEAFFDNKLIFDYNGLQYTPNNDILKHANFHVLKKIALPKTTRQPQAQIILNKEQMTQKYRIKNDKVIVFMGQVMHDMSLKYHLDKKEATYDDFIRKVLQLNSETTFLFKPHPQEKIEKYNLRQYKNAIIINESIETLFSCYDKFVTFSSTTAFEGLIKNRKFAIGGYTLCPNVKLCYHLDGKDKIRNLYENLESFEIDPDIARKHISFITTKYAIDLRSKQLLNKLLLTEKEYYESK